MMETPGGTVPAGWGGETAGPPGAAGTGPVRSSVLPSDSGVSAGLCSEACLLHRSHCDSPPLLRAGSAGKSKQLPSKKVTQQLSKTTTRSLGDLKVCRGTRGLVARFLQRPKRSPAAGMEVPGHSSQGHKQVGSGSHGAPGDRGSSSFPGTPIHTLSLPPVPTSTSTLALPGSPFPCRAPHGVGTPAAGRGCRQSLLPAALSLPSPSWRGSPFPSVPTVAASGKIMHVTTALALPLSHRSPEAVAGMSRPRLTGCWRHCAAREALMGTSPSLMTLYARDAHLRHPCPPALRARSAAGGAGGARGAMDRGAGRAAAACPPRGLQVPWSAWPGAERPHEGIHLQSCGDLSSTSSLRRLLSARRLERSRPRSLSGTCKESVL